MIEGLCCAFTYPNMVKFLGLFKQINFMRDAKAIKDVQHKNKTAELLIVIIIWLCLTRTGNYKIHEFDWLKSILTAV